MIRVACVMGGGLLLAALLGCESEEPAVWRRARMQREGALARSVQMIAATEGHRCENLARTMEVIRERDEQDRKAIKHDVKEVDRLARQEVKRWNDKQPAYRKAIKHQLEGDPASIERTLPHFVY